MTTAELDTEILDLLGEKFSNSSIAEAIRYRIYSRAYRHVIRETWITWRPGATWTIAADDKTFVLTTKLGLAATQDVQDVVRCMYHVSGMHSINLIKVDYGKIVSLRSVMASPGTYPTLYCFRRFSGAGSEAATLEIYGPALDAGSGVLTIDYLLLPNTNLTNIGTAVNPVTPDYADDTIAAFAHAYMLRTKRDPEWKAQLAIANGLLRETRAQSYREAEGHYNFKLRL